MLLIEINQNKTTPIFIQIADEIKRLIDTGILTEGDKLPSSRKLSIKLGVHRSTVYKAYEELWAAGYIESQPGSYSTVRKSMASVKTDKNNNYEQLDWSSKVKKDFMQYYQQNDQTLLTKESKNCINFLPLSPDTELIPSDNLRKSINHVMNTQGPSLLQYNSVDGYEPLKNYLVKQINFHGINATEKEIILTNGVQHSLEILVSLLMQKDACIVVEEPTYASALELFKLAHVKVIAIPTDNGIDLKKLEKVLHSKKVAFVYTMPNFHNPLSVSSSISHREQLLKLCEQYDTIIVEDGFEEELKYYGKAIPPIKSMDKTGNVIYLGTFSKILFPGLRIGWINASEELINYIRTFKRTTQISDNYLIQASIHHFCEAYLTSHLNRLHRVYRKRMTVATKAIRKYLNPDVFNYENPMGGYTFWFQLIQKKLTENQIIDLLKQQQVLVTPGSKFYINPMKTVSFRVSIAHTNEQQIETGIQRMGEALNQI